MKTFNNLASIVFGMAVAPFCLCGVVLGLCRMADLKPDDLGKAFIIVLSCLVPWVSTLFSYDSGGGISGQDDKPEPKR
jgi:hypothetical protein